MVISTAAQSIKSRSTDLGTVRVSSSGYVGRTAEEVLAESSLASAKKVEGTIQERVKAVSKPKISESLQKDITTASKKQVLKKDIQARQVQPVGAVSRLSRPTRERLGMLSEFEKISETPFGKKISKPSSELTTKTIKKIIDPNIITSAKPDIQRKAEFVGRKIKSGASELFAPLKESGKEIKSFVTSKGYKDIKPEITGWKKGGFIKTHINIGEQVATKIPITAKLAATGTVIAGATVLASVGGGAIGGTLVKAVSSPVVIAGGLATQRFVTKKKTLDTGDIIEIATQTAILKAPETFVKLGIKDINKFQQAKTLAERSLFKSPTKPTGKIINLKKTTVSPTEDISGIQVLRENQFGFRPDLPKSKQAIDSFQVIIGKEAVNPVGFIQRAEFAIAGSVIPSNILQVKKPSKRKITKVERRKQTFQRAYDPRTFTDTQAGEYGLRKCKVTIRVGKDKLIKEIKPKGEIEIGLFGKTISKPKLRDTLYTKTGERKRELIFSERQKPKLVKSQLEKLTRPLKASNEFEKFLGGEKSLIKGILIQERKMRTAPLQVQKRNPLPLPKKETQVSTFRLMLKTKKEELTQADVFAGDVIFRQKRTPVRTKGFRTGMRSKIFQRLEPAIQQSRSRIKGEFVIVEPTQQTPTINLPSKLGIKGLTKFETPIKDISKAGDTIKQGLVSGRKSITSFDLATGTRASTSFSQIPRSQVGPRAGLKITPSIKSRLGVGVIPIIKTRSTQNIKQEIDLISAQDTRAITKQKSVLDTKQRQKIKPRVIIPNIIISTTTTPTKTTPTKIIISNPIRKSTTTRITEPPKELFKLTPPIKPPTGRLKTSTSKKQMTKAKKVQAYNVLIKRRVVNGNKPKRSFVKANKKPLTREQAINLGAKVTDTYVERSFTVKKTNKNIKASKVKVNKGLIKKFRTAKRNKNVYVEKSKFAISSMQEKAGIPYKAARLRKAGLIKSKKRISRKKKK